MIAWRLLSGNLAIKLLALLLAVALWMLAKGFTTVEMDIAVPLTLRNVSGGLVVRGKLPASIMVSVAGSRIRFVGFHPERLSLELDAAQLGAGTVVFSGMEKRLALPPEISVLRVYPATIEVTLARQ